jgi:hypothetical protein
LKIGRDESQLRKRIGYVREPSRLIDASEKVDRTGSALAKIYNTPATMTATMNAPSPCWLAKFAAAAASNATPAAPKIPQSVVARASAAICKPHRVQQANFALVNQLF